MQLGRLGVWYSTDKLDGPGLARFVRSVEALGYDTLWYPESRGFESLSIAGFMLANTTTLKIGSSIASIYARDAFTARRGFLTLRDLYGDRFILGLGVSHVPMVEGLRGHVYEKPIPAMRKYLDGILKGEAGSETWPIVVKEINVVGSRCGPFDKALAFLRAGKIDPKPLITRTFPLAEAREAMAFAQRAGVMKVLLKV